jgi:hypothetical protein
MTARVTLRRLLPDGAARECVPLDGPRAGGRAHVLPALGILETMSQDEAADSGTRLEIDWLKAAAGALAAVVSAVLLSQLGAAGTLLGAALGSVVVTISSAVFTQGLSNSRRGLAKAQASARQKVGIAEAEMSRAERAEDRAAREGHLAHAGERVSEANRELEAALAGVATGAGEARYASAVGWRARVAALPWKRIWLVSLAFFVAAVVVITIFELIAGRSVASFTGGTSGDQGTTIGNVVHEQPNRSQPDQRSSESPSPTESTTPTGEPPSETPSTAEPPTDTPTPSPSETPTESPSGLQETGEPSDSPSP